MEDPGGLGGPPTGSAWTKGTLGEIQNTRIQTEIQTTKCEMILQLSLILSEMCLTSRYKYKILRKKLNENSNQTS